jgi:Flp pilus assembly protein TadB
MDQIKRSFLIATLILGALIIGFVATFIDSHVINVTLKMIVIVITFVVIVLAFQSRADRRK